MSTPLFLLLLLFLIELAETTQYRGEHFGEAVNNLYALYKRSLLRFVLYHSSLLFVLYVVVAYGLLNVWTVSILMMKGVDLGLKLYLFRRIEEGGYFSMERYGVGDPVLDWKIRYLSVVVYTSLFIPALF